MRSAILLVFVFHFCFALTAQNMSDTAFVARASSRAVSRYNDFVKGQSAFYTGAEYRQPERTNDDHPFFLDYDWQPGAVVFNDEYYDNVSLLYDLTTDNIITENFYNGEEIVLVKAKIGSFNIRSRKFVHLNGSAVLPGLPSAGFYELMYDGPTRVVARHTKLREERIENSKIEIMFTYKPKYYVLKDGIYHRVSRKMELMKLLQDKKPALRSYIQKEKIKVSKKNPQSFALVASYYDSLNSNSQDK